MDLGVSLLPVSFLVPFRSKSDRRRWVVFVSIGGDHRILPPMVGGPNHGRTVSISATIRAPSSWTSRAARMHLSMGFCPSYHPHILTLTLSIVLHPGRRTHYPLSPHMRTLEIISYFRNNQNHIGASRHFFGFRQRGYLFVATSMHFDRRRSTAEFRDFLRKILSSARFITRATERSF